MLSAKKYIDGFTSRISEKRKTRGARTASRTRRRLGLLEQLEDRRVLATFPPVDVSGLISSINTANANAEDDVIDLGGGTFTLTAIDNDPSGPNAGDAANGLPVVRADGGNSLTIMNGTIERDQTGGTPEFRILSVGGGADLTIQDTVIQGGDLSSSTNTDLGGGIRSTGTLTVIGSSLTSNTPSGLESSGTATIINSTIAANTGAGIVNKGSMSVANTTISGTLGESSNGLLNYGLLGKNADLAVLNSTIANNSGWGITNSTILFGNATLSIHNSILSGNTGGDFSATGSGGGPSTKTGSNNLADQANFPGRIAAVTNFDASLADNGGPTQTHALLPDSNAIDAGDNAFAINPGPDATIGGGDDTPLVMDQRGTGFARIVGGTVDIGAFEFFVETPSLVVTTKSDVVDNTDNLTSLREAIAFANQTPNTLDEITFGDGSSLTGGTDFTNLNADTITLGGTELTISSDITITGPGADLLTVSGNDASRVFDIANGDHDVTLDSFSIADGSVGGSFGGGIRNHSTGTLTITDAVVSDSSGGSGGGIYQADGTLHVERTTLRNNTGTHDGGGIYIDGGTVSLVDSWVADNTAAGLSGGGIRLNGGTLTVIGSTISGNMATTGYGGGINSSGTVAIINSTVSGNTANSLGGGIFSGGSRSLTVVNSTVTGNTAGSASSGGGIRQSSTSTVTIVNSIVAGNTTGGATPDDISGTIDTTNSASNIVGDSGSAGGLTDGTNNNQVGVDAGTVLATNLADNGGPTRTHALVANSPAIDAGDNDLATDNGTSGGMALATDQRGENRILGGTVDIGAFELTPPAPKNVNLSLSSNTGTEAAETIITVTATADSPVSSDQTVVVNVTGTGITSSDFDQLTATITISAGSNTGTADFTIQNDTLVEPTETAIFILSNPSAGLTLGATTSGTVAITDNDTYDTEVTLVSGVLTIQDINGGTSSDDLSISYAGGTYTITDNGGLAITTGIAGATGDGTDTVTIPGSGVTGIRFDLLGGDDLVTVTSVQAALSGGFTITGGAGFDRAVVDGTIATTGIGAVNITTSGPIVLNSGSSVTTVNGGITLDANSAGAQMARFIGLDANNTLIQTTGTGNIQLLGHGAATDSGTSDLYGVDLRGGTRVRSTATGSSAGMIAITGVGGNAAANNFGVRILGSTTEVSSVDGDILINGTGGNGSSLNNHGILASGGRIESTGAGENAASIVITGIGGRGPTGDDGVRIDGFQVSSVAGEITITGTGNGEAPDFRASGASIIGGGTATGAITINANSIALQGTTNVQSTAALTIQPRTAGTTIGIGGGTGDLNLDDTELGMLSDGFSSITIGDASSGDIDINTATFHDALNLITGGEVHDLTGADLNMSGGDTVTVDGTVTPGQSPGVLEVTGDFAFADDSTFEVEIGGTSPGTTNNNHDQIDASGSVSIGSGVVLDLVAVGSFAIQRVGGESFEIINRTGGTGMFDGLDEGDTVSTNFFGSGLSATITYLGGDGDDVVIQVEPPQADISITKDDGVTSAVPGRDVLTYTIVVSNAGPNDDPAVSVTDVIPAALTATYTASASGGASGNTAAGSGDLSELLSLPAGSSVTYTVTASIDPSATGTLANTATATASVVDPDGTNNTATDDDTVLMPAADLSITKTDGQGTAIPGDSVTYTIVVTNNGPSDVTGATVSDTFPAILSGVTYTSVTTGTVNGNTASGSDDISDTVDMSVGATITYTVTGTIDSGATGSLANTATVSSAIDTNSANNSATDTDTLTPQADISITKDDGVTSAVPGQDALTYTIVVSNAGPSDDPAVLVTDVFPAALTATYTSIASGGASGNTAAGTGDLSETLSMPAGSSVTYTVSASINPRATGTLSNTAIATASVTDSDVTNNSATDNDTLLTPMADLSIVMSDSPDPVAPGGTLTYSYNVVNNGPSAAQGATLSFSLDPALTPSRSPWSVGEPIAPGQGAFLVFTSTVAVAATGTLTSGVTVSSSTPDPDTSNNSDLGITQVGGLDYGDAPTGGVIGSPPDSYPTLIAQNGARHVIVPGAPVLGAGIDKEADAQPNATATGDDADAEGDDEDGVAFDSDLIAGALADITVTASAAGGLLNAFVDFNADGDWADAGEQIFTDQPLAAGANSLSFTVPADAMPTGTFARFRIDTGGGLSYDGQAADGEVEDYAVEIQIRTVDLQVSTTAGSEAGQTQITVTAKADGPVIGNQTVDIAVTGTDIELSDYTLSGTQIQIADGETEGSVTFTVLNDDLVEAAETATLTISGPSTGIQLGATTSTDIVIADNDYATLSIDDAEILEGNSGETLMQFTVTLNGQLSTTISPGFETIDGSASGGHVPSVDYQDANSHLSFSPSTATTQTKTITIKINGDTEIEPDETFDVELSPLDNSSGLDIRVVPGKGRATGTILNDDVPLGPQLFFKQVLDERVWLGVNDISPDGIIVFAWGTETGETYLPQYGVTLGIANATLISLAEGGADGTTSGIIPIPFTPEGQAYLFQAFEMAPNPQVTNVLPLNIAGSPVAVMSNNAAPEPIAELPNFTATVGKPFEFDIADDPFVDPDSETPLFYNARQTDGAPLPEWLDFDPANLSFHSHAIPESGQWSITVTATDRGTPVQFTSTTFVLRAIADRSVWQNRSEAVDVNGDGNTTPVDALIVLNHLNSVDDPSLSAQRADGEFQIDVNGDHQVTPIDALRVLNWLNQSAAASNVLVAPSGEYHGDEEEHAESANLNDAAFANAPKIGSLDSFSVTTAFSQTHDGANVDEVNDQDDQQESKEEYEERVDKIFADVF
ncbi:Calx-beta domain protein [Rosistilla carotiformis]|uniref:Calx-beta domain protein n=1 Tax=Rosistilla carotiformis TaxID=2528017 RepID=A0A518JU91_9BACT|nr:choice-of-anchor Q domain-containing protein [Rosistilla carotiformis]QDV69117.1 Calx-beta domain protein [Rosistilla carotiformis]